MHFVEISTEKLIQDLSNKKLTNEWKLYNKQGILKDFDKVMLSKENLSWFVSRDFYVMNLVNEMCYRKLI